MEDESFTDNQFRIGVAVGNLVSLNIYIIIIKV